MPPADPAIARDLAGRLDAVLRRLVEPGETAGLAVADGAAATVGVWTGGDRAPEPAFLAYSITKTFTAVLVLRLQELGRLAIDEPLARWLPAVPDATRITIRQLLNHTAGIPDYGGLPAYHQAVRTTPQTPWTFAQFAAATFDAGLLFEPGTDWAYANPGYMLLVRIAELAGGDAYAALLRQHIVGPLGLRRTAEARTISDLTPLAPAPSTHLTPDGVPVDTRKVYHPGWVSHGVVASTPSDLARFLQALAAGRLLQPRSVQAMTTFVPVPPRLAPPDPDGPGWREPSYGLGVMGDPASPWGVLWGHNGGGPGYGASAFCAPELGGRAVAVAAMAASERGDVAERLLRAAFHAVASR